MRIWILIIIIFIVIIIGFYSYKLIPFSYTPNVPPVLGFLNDELKALNEKDKNPKLTQKEKEEIKIRQEELYSLLSQFYGLDIKQ